MWPKTIAERRKPEPVETPPPQAPAAEAQHELREVQSAEMALVAGSFQLRLKVRVTPLGLLTLGVLLSGVVASSSAVVWAWRRRR